MNRHRLLDLIDQGENSNLEFRRDGLLMESLAEELVGFLNLEGGTVLIGVEDDGSISGTSRESIEEWVAEACRTKIEPPVVPLLSWVRDAEPDLDVLAVRVTSGPDKPYARVHHGRRTYYIRVGSTSREASQDELGRIFQASGRLRYGEKPVPGTDFDALDPRRLRDYLTRVLEGEAPEPDDVSGWETLLRNIQMMTISARQCVATVDGMVLFGRRPGRYVPQSGIRAICYPGTDPDYATRSDEDLRGPMIPLGAEDGSLVEPGLADQAWDFVRRNTTPTAYLDGPRRVDRWEYPEAVVREAVVNALVHRDYSIAGTDIMLAIFSDRMEIVSPGRLPNTVTVEGMRAGARYARNQTLVNIMRDYKYVDAPGMGVRNKIIPGMRDHNGTDPDLIEEEHRFTVRLWKDEESRTASSLA